MCFHKMATTPSISTNGSKGKNRGAKFSIQPVNIAAKIYVPKTTSCSSIRFSGFLMNGITEALASISFLNPRLKPLIALIPILVIFPVIKVVTTPGISRCQIVTLCMPIEMADKRMAIYRIEFLRGRREPAR